MCGDLCGRACALGRFGTYARDVLPNSPLLIRDRETSARCAQAPDADVRFSIRSQNSNTKGESILDAPCAPFPAGGEEGVGSLVSLLGGSRLESHDNQTERSSRVGSAIIGRNSGAAIKRERDDERGTRDSL